MEPFWQWLARSGAQNDLVEWARPYDADAEALWRECPRGDWMLAIAARLGTERGALVTAACRCARLALAQVPDDDARAAEGLDAAEAWGQNGGDTAACMEHRDAIAQALDEADNPAESAALIAAMCAVETVADPAAAANAAAFATQAAVLDAGDCAMQEAMRYVHRKSAQAVREAIAQDALIAAWQRAE